MNVKRSLCKLPPSSAAYEPTHVFHIFNCHPSSSVTHLSPFLSFLSTQYTVRNRWLDQFPNYYMSTKKSSRKSQDKNRKVRLTDKAMSFHGQPAEEMVGKLRRPRTVPDLISGRVASSTGTARPKLTKLLLNVTVQRSLSPLQVLISPESTVSDLIAAALRQYCKEGRRPILPSLDPSGFGLHYSQFSLESLDPDEKLFELGSRNFFLCPKRTATTAGSCDDDGGVGFERHATSSACSKEVETVTKTGVGWLRFMNFLQ